MHRRTFEWKLHACVLDGRYMQRRVVYEPFVLVVQARAHLRRPPPASVGTKPDIDVVDACRVRIIVDNSMGGHCG